jgi:carbon-monoxide dehydrogenase small subunit
VRLSVTVNGARVEREVEPRTLLVDFIRDDLDLTGTNIGCDTSQCGACTIHIDGEAAKSCTLLAVQVDGSTITTIEGLARDGELHPVQEAFTETGAVQCGFCTPGLIVAAADLLAHNPTPGEDELREALSGNLCRCTGYAKIFDAVRFAVGLSDAK